jgi:hypothetical protein
MGMNGFEIDELADPKGAELRHGQDRPQGSFDTEREKRRTRRAATMRRAGAFGR